VKKQGFGDGKWANLSMRQKGKKEWGTTRGQLNFQSKVKKGNNAALDFAGGPRWGEFRTEYDSPFCEESLAPRRAVKPVENNDLQ